MEQTQTRNDINLIRDSGENDHQEIIYTFWTKPRKQFVFASSFLLLTPLVYFLVSNPSFRADTLKLLGNYPTHSFAIIVLLILQLRAVYNKYVEDDDVNHTNNKEKEDKAPFALRFTHEPTTIQNTSFWTNHKRKIITLGIAAIAILAYFEYTNSDVAKKTFELGRDNPVIIFGMALIVIAAIYYNHRQSKIAEKNDDQNEAQQPKPNEAQQPKPNKFISLAKEQAPLVCAVGVLFVGNYAYQHWDATLDAFSKPWVAGVSIGIVTLVVSTVALKICCDSKKQEELEKDREQEKYQDDFYERHTVY